MARTSQKYKENSTILYRRKRKIEIGKGKKIAWGFELQGSISLAFTVRVPQRWLQ
jgi:hypothetical protein